MSDRSPVVDFDVAVGIIRIWGISYSIDLFQHMAETPCGISFRIIKREDGVVTISTERDPLSVAAPDMLTALQAYLNARPQCECTDAIGCQMEAARVLARNAIQKATGATQ